MSSMTKRIALLIHPKMASFGDRVVLMLAEGLREISIEPDIVPELPAGFSGKAIVLGANFYDPVELMDRLDLNSIILNVENSSSQFMTDNYIKILKKFRVFDYDKSNAAFLSEATRKTGTLFQDVLRQTPRAHSTS